MDHDLLNLLSAWVISEECLHGYNFVSIQFLDSLNKLLGNSHLLGLRIEADKQNVDLLLDEHFGYAVNLFFILYHDLVREADHPATVGLPKLHVRC